MPATQPHQFIRVDEYGRLMGLDDVYAAGDVADFPVKQGRVAAQQADAVAEHVAASYGVGVEPAPFAPVLRGMLFTGGNPLYVRSGVPGADPSISGAWYPLWWPPTKVAGRYLAPYLLERSEEDDGVGGPPWGSSTSTSHWPRSHCPAERSRADQHTLLSVGSRCNASGDHVLRRGSDAPRDRP